jgi:hypothetical protein
MTSARTTYTFCSSWLVPAPRDRVYEVLEDIAGYPSWWPQVRAVVKVDEDTALVVCRSVLPYTLHFAMSSRRRDPRAGVLEAVLDGDLVGTCRWGLTEGCDGTLLEFTQEVCTPGWLLRIFARVARPLLVLNHDLMMRGCRRGLVERMHR